MAMIGRIELRTIDEDWVASYRLPGSGAVELGRIKLSLVENSAARREQFQQLMKDAIDDIVQGAGGPLPTWKRSV